MASPTQLIFLIISLLLLITSTTTTASYAKTTTHNPDRQPEKQTHLRLYWHDIVSGPNPTAVNIVKPPPPKSNSSAPPSFFGAVAMIDDPLTVSPDVGSKLVGRAQGLYALSDQTGSGILMAMNFAFMDGEYNGSTIAIMGRNEVADKVREMPVVGGSGVFRFARGYVQARTHTFDLKTGDATVEYNCYVLHY